MAPNWWGRPSCLGRPRSDARLTTNGQLAALEPRRRIAAPNPTKIVPRSRIAAPRPIPAPVPGTLVLAPSTPPAGAFTVIASEVHWLDTGPKLL